jgi:hypothetical protein
MKITRMVRCRTKFVVSHLLTGIYGFMYERHWTMLTEFRTFRKPKYGYARHK